MDVPVTLHKTTYQEYYNNKSFNNFGRTYGMVLVPYTAERTNLETLTTIGSMLRLIVVSTQNGTPNALVICNYTPGTTEDGDTDCVSLLYEVSNFEPQKGRLKTLCNGHIFNVKGEVFLEKLPSPTGTRYTCVSCSQEHIFVLSLVL